jgi:mRNA interferase MazF
MDMVRFDIYYINLNPTLGSEINKIRPCVIISPDEMNQNLNTVIVAPLTSTIKRYPVRVNCVVTGKQGQIALDHIRAVDKSRLGSKIAHLDADTQTSVIKTLFEMFS